MRILHVVPTYIPAWRDGGPIYSVHGLCKALVALGHEVHVYTTNVNGAADSDVPLEEAVDIDGVKVWYFRSRFLRRLYYSPSMMQCLKKEIKSSFGLPPPKMRIYLYSTFYRMKQFSFWSPIVSGRTIL